MIGAMEVEKAIQVVVAHPGRQHSHEAALALDGAGWLAGYWAGIPCLAHHARWVPEFLWKRMMRYHFIDLPPARVRWLPWPPLMRKFAMLVPSLHLVGAMEYWGHALFDWWTSRGLYATPNLTAVIAYENSAVRTFKAAKRLGLVTILDAASVHHTAQKAEMVYGNAKANLQRTRQQKDMEISLADHIVTASAMARQSYLSAGVAPDRVHEVTLGADLKIFGPVLRPRREETRPFRFLYVGKTNIAKGIDTLLAAFCLVNGDRAARLEIVGPIGDGHHLVENEDRDDVKYLPPKLQPDLVALYQDADCLILPSRFDSFGMVVAEALACGLPVIVSDMVGAKSLVVEGENGWIVQVGNIDVLAQRLRWCIDHRSAMASMREAAARSAQLASWKHYHQRLISTLSGILKN